MSRIRSEDIMDTPINSNSSTISTDEDFSTQMDERAGAYNNTSIHLTDVDAGIMKGRDKSSTLY
jgi:hypothetical protein